MRGVARGKRHGVLGTMTPGRFLREYWQRKPLLIRQAVPGFVSPLTPDELAGLALEEMVESRLVLEQGSRGRWELRNGPFTAKSFATLPDKRWTLLVQAVDQWVPEVHALRAHFDFLPPWRFDDVMLSYAVDKGGVGPHFDYYDVFLLQGLGRRRWRVGELATADSPIRDDTPLRILKKFTTVEEFVLEPGDMLYIPPGVAHWGIAEGECMTYSFGFRAPSHADILLEMASLRAQSCADDQRYTDPALAARDAGGEISATAVRRVQKVLREMADDQQLVRDWFGRTMTERKYPELELADTTRRRRLRAGAELTRNPASRYAWAREGKGAALFVDGEVYPCSETLARLLGAGEALDARTLQSCLRRAADRELLERLVAQGALRYGD